MLRAGSPQEGSAAPRTMFLALSSIYAAGMIWVWAGIFIVSGVDHFALFAVFLLSTVLCFGIALAILQRLDLRLSVRLLVLPDSLVVVLLGAALLAAAAHFALLGGIPLLAAVKSSDPLEIAKLRQSISDASPLFNYLSPLLVKVAYPLLAIAFVAMGRARLAAIALLLGMAYAASLMQKSYPLYAAVPVAIYLGMSRRFLAAASVIAVASVVVVVMAMIANGMMAARDVSHPAAAVATATGTVKPAPGVTLKSLGSGLIDRVLVTPGETVADWFDAFPASYSFELGCGYRFVAPLLGCRFVNNSELMFRHSLPNSVARGLTGTLNAAHFAEEYANFGPLGLALAPLLAACVILLAAILTAGLGVEASVAVNLPFILTLTSSALHTTLLSGGWAAAVALSLILLGSRRPGRRGEGERAKP
jgi:hypothetical protein